MSNNNDLFLAFGLGESDSPSNSIYVFSHKRRDFKYDSMNQTKNNVFNYKRHYKTKEYHLDNFFNQMISIFEQFHADFIPKNIDEIECQSTDQYYVFIKNNKFHIYHINAYRKLINKPSWRNPQSHLLISYGVSGGLNMGFNTLLIKKDSVIDYIV